MKKQIHPCPECEYLDKKRKVKMKYVNETHEIYIIKDTVEPPARSKLYYIKLIAFLGMLVITILLIYSLGSRLGRQRLYDQMDNQEVFKLCHELLKYEN